MHCKVTSRIHAIFSNLIYVDSTDCILLNSFRHSMRASVRSLQNQRWRLYFVDLVCVRLHEVIVTKSCQKVGIRRTRVRVTITIMKELDK